MAKKIIAVVNLQIPAGKAEAKPPVGPALGQHGVNIMQFCTDFNAKTKSMEGMTLPVVITIYSDKTFSYVTKTPLTSELIKKALNIEKGASLPKREVIAKLSMQKIREIAEIKMKDMWTTDVNAAIKTVIGTAKSMGIEVQEN